MLKAKTAKIPMQKTILLPWNTSASELEKTKHLAKIGSIMYAIVKTRINIAFATSMVSWFTKNLSSEHFNAIDQILQYLAGSLNKGMIFRGDEKLKIIKFSDFD